MDENPESAGGNPNVCTKAVNNPVENAFRTLATGDSNDGFITLSNSWPVR
jgi:hypothetical protein